MIVKVRDINEKIGEVKIRRIMKYLVARVKESIIMILKYLN